MKQELGKYNRLLSRYIGKSHILDSMEGGIGEFLFTLLEGVFINDDEYIGQGIHYFDDAIEMVSIIFLHEKDLEKVPGYEPYLRPNNSIFFGIDRLEEQDYHEILKMMWERLMPYTREGKLQKIFNRIW